MGKETSWGRHARVAGETKPKPTSASIDDGSMTGEFEFYLVGVLDEYFRVFDRDGDSVIREGEEVGVDRGDECSWPLIAKTRWTSRMTIRSSWPRIAPGWISARMAF
jgi:hypothetical protein